MIYAFTGPSRVLTLTEKELIADTLERLTSETFRTGGAWGVDTFVGLSLALMYPRGKHVQVIPAAPWSGIRVPGSTIEFAPAGRTNAESYMLRNDALIEPADLLVAFPATGAEQRRSGTWATIRRARRAGVPVRIVPLNGEPER